MVFIKKVLKEVGLVGIIRIPFILIKLLIYNIKLRKYNKGSYDLYNDLKHYSDNYETFRDILQNQYLDRDNSNYNTNTLNWILKASNNRNFYSTVKDLSTFSSYLLKEKDIQRINNFLEVDREEEKYRSHNLNKGKNDYWEYYLTPWQRLAVSYSILLWDDRFRNSMLRLHSLYRKWYKEFIWFLTIGTKSNIFSSESGKALYCLNEYFLTNNTEVLNRYRKHILRLKFFIDNCFDKGIPLEGNLYGKFSLINVIHLDQIHRKLGFKFRLIDDTFIEDYARYLEFAWTVDSGFETSGDSYKEDTKLILPEVIIYFNKISNKKIFSKIIKFYEPKDFHFRLISNSL